MEAAGIAVPKGLQRFVRVSQTVLTRQKTLTPNFIGSISKNRVFQRGLIKMEKVAQATSLVRYFRLFFKIGTVIPT